jgi:sulfotransferase
MPEQRRIDCIKGLINSYYHHQQDKEVIFNTNRAWSVMTPLVKRLFPESKIILCVRDINWVLDSFELAHRRNPLSVNTTMGGLSGTVYSRTEELMKETGFVGFPLLGIKQAITSNERDICLLVEYDDLCKNPKQTMKKIYEFIGEPYYEHDFDNVEASWDEYDKEIGMSLHNVKKKIQYKPRNFILPPDIQARFRNLEVWRMVK